MIDFLDVIIIGAGPAGLAAGSVLNEGKIHYLILEKGNDLVLRDANNPKDVSSGIGGGGLFSDGKLSFPPSASNLWLQLNSDTIKDSYIYLSNILNNLNINIPSFENVWVEKQETYMNTQKKEFMSIVLNNFMRNRVLNFFYDINAKNIITNCCVTTITKNNDYYVLTSNTQQEFYCKKIIISSGKFGNKLLEGIDYNDSNKFMNKIEIGIRVESKLNAFIPYSSPSTDYKLIEKIENGVEFRTFCCCRDGAVIKSEFDNYISYNGTNTHLVTDTSNIGLLIRATDIKSTFYHEMNNLLKHKIYPFNVPIKIFIENKDIYIGEKCDAILKDKLAKILNFKNSDINFCHVYGPEIEYVGKYMTFDKNLNVSKNIWIAGDVSGNFRGLMAALVSGIHSSKNIIKSINDSINKNISQLGVKLSSIENLELIFTAQSKKFFYCRDVICQFVLEREKLPINPFRVFDYFLSDKVNRDIIRRGNNQLIRSCKELWVFGPVADGVLFEIALAKLNGKNIRFFSISTRVNEIKEILDLNDVVFEPEVHARQITKNDLIKFITDNNIYDDQPELPLF
jgi:uncharacterized FAD-dependent dehydrogenase/anti-anti-sigma regulatory factor